jgi:hypothetical protein
MWRESNFFLLSIYGRNLQESPSKGANGNGRHSPHDVLGNLSAQQNAISSQGLLAQQIRSGYQMSSSLTDYAQPGISGRFAGDNSYVTGNTTSSFHLPMGPQSYSDLGNSGHGALNAPDFAFALQRPGVVPMGESFSSSIDTNPRPLHHQQSVAPGYLTSGGHPVNSILTNAMTSRSYGESSDSGIDSLRRQYHGGVGPSSWQQQMSYGGSHGGHSDANGIMNPQRNERGQSLDKSPSDMGSSYPPQDLSSSADYQQQQIQLYLQQQHAALQQQQALLQQQQAAIAIQQQQLRAYGVNPPGLNSIGTNPNGNALGMNTNPSLGMNQYGGTTGGEYYYVNATDGNPMLMSQGLNQQHDMSNSIPNAYGAGMPQYQTANTGVYSTSNFDAYGNPTSNFDAYGNPTSNIDTYGNPEQRFHAPSGNQYRGGTSM